MLKICLLGWNLLHDLLSQVTNVDCLCFLTIHTSYVPLVAWISASLPNMVFLNLFSHYCPPKESFQTFLNRSPTWHFNTTDKLFYQLMFCVHICTLHIKKLSCFSSPKNHSYSCWECMTCQTRVVWFGTQQKQITELNARWNQFGKKIQEDGRHKSTSRLSLAWVRTDSRP